MITPYNAVGAARLWYRLLFTLAAVSCAFSLLVAMLMVSNLLTVRTASPLNLPELAQLQAALKADPDNEALKTKIRDLDFVARSFYFSGQTSLRTGAFLLLGGLLVTLLCLKGIMRFHRRPPDPRSFPAWPDPARAATISRRIIGGTAMLLIAGTLLLGLWSDETPRPAATPERPGTGDQPPASPSPASAMDPFEAQAATNWPGFRGRSGSGISPFTNAPCSWDGASGSGILWKAAVPQPGLSSPIAWGNRVFLTGASPEKREVYCYDLHTGTLLWQTGAPAPSGVAKASPEVFQDTGYAAPTPVTDGTSVYSIFANGDVAAFDHCARPLWTTDLGAPINRYGYASSLAIYKDRILIQYDNETDKGGVSQLIALDANTGKRVWTTPRPVADAWPSPVILQTAKGPQLVTAANEWVIAYNPDTGQELWRVQVHGTDSSATPILAGGLILVSVAADKVYAIRPDGQGDVTATHVAWQSDSGISDVSSPVSNGELAFFANASGHLTCLEVASGKVVWEHDMEGEFYGSPGLAGDRLYLVARNGQVFILKAARQYGEIARAHLGEPSDGSPVFIQGRILIRGLKHLFCIGAHE